MFYLCSLVNSFYPMGANHKKSPVNTWDTRL
jgi:hypothetical protein